MIAVLGSIYTRCSTWVFAISLVIVNSHAQNSSCDVNIFNFKSTHRLDATSVLQLGVHFMYHTSRNYFMLLQSRPWS